MTENIYQAPSSTLLEQADTSSTFYIVSPKKCALLFAATLGLYSLYWFFKHWREYKLEKNLSIWPVPRAIFSIFFAHSLFQKFDEEANKTGTKVNWSPNGMATLYVVFSIVETVVDRLTYNGVGEPYLDLAWFPILFIVGWSLYKAQTVANIACSDPSGESNSRISVANIIWLIVGGLFWLLILIGYYEILIGLPEFS